jgi:hypothetical protein
VRLCLLRSTVTVQDYLRDSKHRRHTHLSPRDAAILAEKGFVKWVRVSRNVKVLQHVSNSHRFQMRGLSCTAGAGLAMAIERLLEAKLEGRNVRAEWDLALTMLDHIRAAPRPKTSRTGPKKKR